MSWYEITALAVGGLSLFLLFALALCRSAKLSDEIAERCNREWLIGQGGQPTDAPPGEGDPYLYHPGVTDS